MHTDIPPPSRLPDQEVDADDTLTGDPGPLTPLWLSLGPQVATTPGQEAVLPRYCLALAQHWGGVWEGLGKPRREGNGRGMGYEGSGKRMFPGLGEPSEESWLAPRSTGNGT